MFEMMKDYLSIRDELFHHFKARMKQLSMFDDITLSSAP